MEMLFVKKVKYWEKIFSVAQNHLVQYGRLQRQNDVIKSA
jgi:hypothetical protein